MATGFYFDESCLWHTTGENVIIASVGGYLQPPSGGGHAENPETKRGVNGRPFETRVVDIDLLTPEGTVAAFQSLVEGGVQEAHGSSRRSSTKPA